MTKQPDAKIADKVRRCIRAGLVDTTKIAKLCRISVRELEQTYSYELETSNDEELMEVADTLYDMAVSGKFPHVTMWFLKQRGPSVWKEEDTSAGSTSNPIVIKIADSTPSDEDDDM